MDVIIVHRFPSLPKVIEWNAEEACTELVCVTYIIRAQCNDINDGIATQIRTNVFAITIVIINMIAAQNHVVSRYKHRFDWLG